MTAKSFKGSSKILTEGQPRKRQKVSADIEDDSLQLFTQQQMHEVSKYAINKRPSVCKL